MEKQKIKKPEHQSKTNTKTKTRECWK
jgi:hypothetical protein